MEQWYAEQNVGRYFLNRGWLSIEQVCTVMENRENARVKLETLAIAFGFMTPQQVRRTLSLQAMLEQRFGAAAVEAGYLTQSQADRLLDWPENANLNFCQAVLDFGYMTLDELDAALKELRATAGNAELMPVFSEEARDPLFAIYVQYARFFLRLAAENLGAQALELRRDAALSEVRLRLFWQRFKGRAVFCAGFAAAEPTLLALAHRFSHEAMPNFDALAVDSVKEFLNLHNGLFAVHLSNEGLEVDLEPVEMLEDAVLAKETIVVRTEFGDIALALADAKDWAKGEKRG